MFLNGHEQTRSDGKARNHPVKEKEEKSSFGNVLVSVEQCLVYGSVVVLMVGILFKSWRVKEINLKAKT